MAKFNGKVVYTDTIDNGGMFPDKLYVVEDDFGGLDTMYRAVVETGWGGGYYKWRNSKEEAIAYCYQMHEQHYGG